MPVKLDYLMLRKHWWVLRSILFFPNKFPFCFFFPFVLISVIFADFKSSPLPLPSGNTLPTMSTRGQHAPVAGLSVAFFSVGRCEGALVRTKHIMTEHRNPPVKEHCREFRYTIRESLRALVSPKVWSTPPLVIKSSSCEWGQRSRGRTPPCQLFQICAGFWESASPLSPLNSYEE